MTDKRPHGKFKHQKYIYTNRWDTPSHRWEIIDPDGGIHFHVQIRTKEPHPYEACGLEFHSRTPRGEATAPDHLRCPLLEGPCWHDGTSLYAQETLWPVIRMHLECGDHDAVFRYLEMEYERYFEEDAE